MRAPKILELDCGFAGAGDGAADEDAHRRVVRIFIVKLKIIFDLGALGVVFTGGGCR